MGRVIISGANSGVGKTTVTTALLSIFDDVQAFKIGPDFIDPKLHKFVTGKPSYNLDSFIYDQKTIKYLFDKYSSSKLNIIEGVMGLYDGLGHALENNSTAMMSRLLDAPVIIVVDGFKQATSIAAHVKGLIDLDPRVNVAGVILNRCTEHGYNYLKSAIELHCDVQCLGYLPNDDDLRIKERHLGLMQAEEVDNLSEKIEKLKNIAKSTLDITSIQKIASKAKDVVCEPMYLSIEGIYEGKTVAFAKDEAFSFIYQSHIDLFIEAGAKIIYFSPIHDDKLPNADLYIFPGGYPELHLEGLCSNKSMIESVRQATKTKRILAECGGFIYLSKGIYYKNNYYQLCDVYDIDIEFTNKLDIRRFGYINIKHKDIEVKGHEFHYSRIYRSNEENEVYEITNKNYKCGFKKNKVIAGYPHILYYSNLDYFKKLLED